MNEPLKVSLVAAILLFAGAFFFQNKIPEKSADSSITSGDYSPMPSIDMSNEYANYAQSFKTYESDLGFSFKSPPYLKATIDTGPTTSKIILAPVDANTDGGLSAIIISVAKNNVGLTPEEWLLGPNSGFDHSDGYFKTTIDGENAVYTNGGMWTVINTPDDKYRLSVTNLAQGNADILFTEMGIVIESLAFS